MVFDFDGKRYTADITSILSKKPQTVYTGDELGWYADIDGLEIGFFYDVETEEIEVSAPVDDDFILVFIVDFPQTEKDMIVNYAKAMLL